MLKKISSCLVLLTCTVAWSGIGHDIVGQIAMAFMDADATVPFVERTLQLGRIPLQNVFKDVGRWADTVPSQMDWSRRFHYVALPTRRCSGFEYGRDCNMCIVSALTNYTMRVIDSGLDRDDRQEALMFLVHLMADIHQPMHVGFIGDKGGNKIDVTYPGSRSDSNLHNVWDFHLIQSINGHKFAESVKPPQSDDLFDMLRPDDLTPKVLVAVFSAIADETSYIACDAYHHETTFDWIEPGDVLETEYFDKYMLVAANQLLRAGIRLAKLLNLLSHAVPIVGELHPLPAPRIPSPTGSHKRNDTDVNSLSDISKFVPTISSMGWYVPLMMALLYSF